MGPYGNRNAAIWIANTARQLNSSLLSVKKIKQFPATAHGACVSGQSEECAMQLDRRQKTSADCADFKIRRRDEY